MKKVRDWSDDLLWRKVGARNFEAFCVTVLLVHA